MNSSIPERRFVFYSMVGRRYAGMIILRTRSMQFHKNDAVVWQSLYKLPSSSRRSFADSKTVALQCVQNTLVTSFGCNEIESDYQIEIFGHPRACIQPSIK